MLPQHWLLILIAFLAGGIVFRFCPQLPNAVGLP